jgi:formylmethanofuran dehydrogenase subunit E
MAKTLFWGKTSCDTCDRVMHDAQVYYFDSRHLCLVCYASKQNVLALV